MDREVLRDVEFTYKFRPVPGKGLPGFGIWKKFFGVWLTILTVIILCLGVKWSCESLWSDVNHETLGEMWRNR
jgi:hypothetical protein